MAGAALYAAPLLASMDEVGMRMQYKSKVDLIYEELMDNITSGVYQCGDRLNIRQIAQKNKISEIPVREAIRRLESEGYVTVHANQGATVNEMTDADVMEIFQLKGLLEGYAARLAIDYLTPEDYQKLRQINDELRQAKELIAELWKKWRITKTVFEHSPDRSANSVPEHEEILRLMEQRRYDETEMCVRNHKYRAGYDLAEYIKKKN